MKKMLVRVIIANILLIAMMTNVFAVSVNDDFKDGEVGADWSITSSDSSAVSGTGDSLSRLLIQRGDEELSTSKMVEYQYSNAALEGDICYVDMDFSYTTGSTFQIRNVVNDGDGGDSDADWRGCWLVTNNRLQYYVGSGNWRTAATITPNDKHTIRLAITSGTTYDIYVDGKLVKENAEKQPGMPNQFAGFITGKNSALSIYRLAVTAEDGSFEEDFSDETITTLNQKNWSFPISTGLSYAEVSRGESKALAFEANTRAKLWLVDKDDACSVNGQPTEITVKFMYEEGASMQLRVRAAGSKDVAYIHLSNDTLQHQYSRTGFATIATNLSPMTEYTLKVSCHTFKANTVSIYLDGECVSQNRSYMGGGYPAPRWIEVLNLTDTATGSEVYLNYVGTTTDPFFVNEMASDNGARLRTEDYTQNATAGGWRQIDSYSLPSIKTVEGTGERDPYMYITRTGVGGDYTASYALPDSNGEALLITTDIAYRGAGTNVIALRNDNGDTAELKIEDGQVKCADTAANITPYEKHKLTFYMAGSATQVYIDGKNIADIGGVTNPTELAFTNTAQNADEISKGRLFSTLYIYGISAETAEGKNITVEEAKLVDIDGEQVQVLQADGTKCLIKLKNEGAITGAYVLLAIYDGENLYKVISDTIVLSENALVGHTINIPGLSNANDLDVRLFVWDVDYSPIVASGKLIDLLEGEDGIDFADINRKYINDDFSWDVVDTFPTGYYCEADSDVKVKSNGGDNYISIDKMSSDSATDLVKYFPPMANKLSFEISIMSDSTDGTKIAADLKTSVFRDNSSVIKMELSNGSIYASNNSSNAKLTSFEAGKWYDIKLEIDLDKGSYDVYVDGRLVRQGLSVNKDITSGHLGQVRFGMESGQTGNLSIDNVKLYSSGEASTQAVTAAAQSRAAAPEGFDTTPREDVPNNSDWMKTYQAAPEGKVIEAENMTLVNFTAVNKANAYNGKAIQVSGAGNASATYTFDGESGDYAIKVGYLEDTQKKDSLFRVYHNGEEIDFWYGQFDDGLLHVRDVKNKRHIERGDVFVIEGYDGEDPSTVDYLQFSDPLTPDFERGYLVQEEFHAPGNYARSSWEVSEAGGSARIMNGSRNFGIMDNSTTQNVWAKRAILAQSGVVSSEFDMIYTTADDGITMSWRDGEKEIVRFVTVASTVYAENLMGDRVAVIGSYQQNRQYKAKVTMDIPNKQITVIAPNGTTTTMDMQSDIEKIDNFYMYTGKESKGWMKLKSLDIYTGYTVNETFKALNAGVKPGNWTLTGNARVAQVNNESLFDTMALNMPTGSKAAISYGELTGESTAKFSLLMKGNGIFEANVGNAKVSVEDGDLYITAGEKVKIWEDIKANYVYYNILLEQTANGKLDVYVNNIKKATLDFALKHSKIDFAVVNCTAVVDNVVIHPGIVTSDVPEVEKVDTGDYIIGMQTCDLWHEGEHFGWDFVRPYDNRTPLVGYYDDADQTTVDWEIKYWAEHGVSLYAPCWYRDFTTTALRSGANDGKVEAFKHSRYSDKMKFMMVYENSGRFRSENDFLNYVLNYWIEHYIKHPSYLVIDNKPVIAIWNNYYFAEDAGSDAANGQLFEKAEDMLRAEGFDGAIWITNWNGSDEATAQQQITRGYDYVYYYGGGHPIEEQMSRFADQQAMGKIDGIMSISQGWGAEAWGLDPRKTNLTLDEFRRGLEYTKNTYMEGFNETSLGAKMVLFGNWNEIGEGHMYVPSKLTGFGYLDQIREVFGVNAGEHTDIVPENTLDSLYPGLWD